MSRSGFDQNKIFQTLSENPGPSHSISPHIQHPQTMYSFQRYKNLKDHLKDAQTFSITWGMNIKTLIYIIKSQCLMGMQHSTAVQIGYILIFLRPWYLMLVSCFSRVRLCATPQTAAHQAPPSLGFSRREHWSGLPFPSPGAYNGDNLSNSFAVSLHEMPCANSENSSLSSNSSGITSSTKICFNQCLIREELVRDR